MSKRVVIDDATLNLIKSSRAAPSVLVNRLVTDMIERDYGKGGEALLKARSYLWDKMIKAISKDPLVKMIRDQGGRIDVSLPSRDDGISWSNKETIQTHWRGLDTSHRKHASTGLRYSIEMGLYKHGVAFGFLATAVDQFGDNSYDQTGVKKIFGTEKNPLRKGWYQGKYCPSWNCVSSSGKPALTVELQELLPTHAQAFSDQLAKEVEFVKAMVKDVLLLLEKGGKARSLETLFKAMPALLEHKDLKTLLGYHANPQRERIEILTGLVTGETLLSA